MERLEAHWNGKVEIDAQECKHTEALQIGQEPAHVHQEGADPELQNLRSDLAYEELLQAFEVSC
jgi:hypothetical protein